MLESQTCPTLQVTVSKDDTIILDGGGNKAMLEERTEQVVYSYLYVIDVNYLQIIQRSCIAGCILILSYTIVAMI